MHIRFLLLGAVVLLAGGMLAANTAADHDPCHYNSSSFCISQLYTTPSSGKGNSSNQSTYFSGLTGHSTQGVGNTSNGGSDTTLFLPPEEALLGIDLLIECQACWSQRDGEIVFEPTIVSGTPLTLMRVCKTSNCDDTTSSSRIWCEDTTGGKTCSFSFSQCTFSPDNDFWIYAENRDGDIELIKGGIFDIKKELGCICTANEECLSGLCRDNQCTATTPPKLYFQ